MCVVEVAMPSVKPSGAALAIMSEPITPLAPARFSTITGCPSLALKRWLIRRVITSTAEPAGSGTIIRSGRSGQLAVADSGRADAAPATTIAKIGTMMSASANRIGPPQLLCGEGCTAAPTAVQPIDTAGQVPPNDGPE